MANVIEILVTGRNLTKPAFDEAARNGRAIGQQVGDEFTKGVGDKVTKDLPPKIEAPLEDSGRKGGEKFSDGFKQTISSRNIVDMDVPAKKGGDLAGKAAGDSFLAKASPLMVGAFAAAATVGPGLLIAGTAAAVLGAGALIAKGNAQVSASYQQLGKDGANAITAATAPLVPDLLGAVRVLDDGLAKAGPELKDTFAAAAPYARDLTGGIVSLVDNALPGFVSLLRAGAPYAHEMAIDFGKIGSGAGGLLAGLGGGASGGMAGFSALATVIEQLLPDIGQLVGDLSNGLGPALHDIVTVADPAAHLLTDVVNAVPPGALRAAADAATALFLAFKVGTLTGLIAEGTAFTAWLGGAGIAAKSTAVSIYALEGAETTATAGAIAMGLAEAGAATATAALGTAASAALGPWGLLAGAIYLGTENIRVAGIRLGDLNPEKAIQNIRDLTSTRVITSFGDVGHAVDGAAGTIAQYANFAERGVLTADQLSTALTQAGQAAAQSAQKSATGTLAALGLRDGQSALATGLDNILQSYTGATTGASAYNTMLQALFGTTASLDDAQNSMAQDLLNLKTSFKANGEALDLNTQAGISNRQSLSNAAKAAVSLATAQYQATGDMGKANQTLQQQENAIVKATGATGKAKDAIIAYLNQIMKIPPDVTTNVYANTKPAQSGVIGLLHWINSTSASIPVGVGGPAHAGLAHGGIVGSVGMAAAGGPRSNLTMVGEHGIELLDLAPGTRVHSNPDTQRMLAQGSGGAPARVQVELVASGAEEEFLRFLRRAIRVRGGDVQNVLGRS